MKKLILFASGSGSNVENIANYFHGMPGVTIDAVLSNKRDAQVIDRCNRLEINAFVFNRQAFLKSDGVFQLLKCLDPDLIVLAGFLWKVPENIVDYFDRRMINIHPALLPGFGGKGMYGMKVHEAVKASGAKESGITIHWVSKNYDEGNIIFQAKTGIDDSDEPQDIARKIHELEHRHYPEVIAQLLAGQNG